MNTRISNTKSYIFSAIVYAGDAGVTCTEVAKILIEQFSLPKNVLKAKAFAYNQLQNLVAKDLMTKEKKKGIYQHVYTRTDKFNIYLNEVQPLLNPSAIHESIDSTSIEKIRLLIYKYEVESEKTHGAKEIYDELSIELPTQQSEYRRLSDEQNRKLIRLQAKINTLSRILD